MKRIAILETDILPGEIVEQFGSYAQMCQRLLLSGDASLQFDCIDVVNGQTPDLSQTYDAYLITGSKADAYSDETWVVQLRCAVQKLFAARQKLIGICFGHQLIAHSLGGKTEKSTKGWGVGLHRAHIKSPASWMQSATDEYSVIYSHQDQVVQLPPQATLIAASDFCPIAMYRIEDRVFCLQGHPEFSREYCRYLLESREDCIEPACIKAGLASLALPDNANDVRDWILAFIG